MTTEKFLRLTFGVEIECVLAYPAGIFGTGPKDVKMRREVEELLDKKDIPTNELRGDDPLIYEKWTINEDATIKKPRNTSEEEYEDMEIISRVFHYDDPISFEEIREVLGLVRSNFKIVEGTKNSCGLHVHIGNEDRGFHIEVLRRYALLVTAFEHLLLSLIPAYRIDPQRSHKCFCYPPSKLPDFEALTLQERLDKIRVCEREWQLQELMSPIWHGKNLAFNIGSHGDRTKRTIEHRMFPGTTDVEEILANVELCVSLMSFAWRISNENLDTLLESAFNSSFELKHLLCAFGKAELWDLLHDNACRRKDWDVLPPITRQDSLNTPTVGSPTDASPISPRSYDSGIAMADTWDVFVSGGEEVQWLDDENFCKRPRTHELDPEELLAALLEKQAMIADTIGDESVLDLDQQNFEGDSGFQSKTRSSSVDESSVSMSEDFEGLAELFGEAT
ncbi:hypothetical protein MMC10_009943 [Thelotrema lepadinum]|nr:hypothetical protein [Thelotrema lepadinum]